MLGIDVAAGDGRRGGGDVPANPATADDSTRASRPTGATVAGLAGAVVLIALVSLLVQVHRLRDAVSDLQTQVAVSGPSSVDTPSDADQCRLLGAIARAHDLRIARLFLDQEQSDCESNAHAAAAVVAAR